MTLLMVCDPSLATLRLGRQPANGRIVAYAETGERGRTVLERPVGPAAPDLLNQQPSSARALMASRFGTPALPLSDADWYLRCEPT